MRWPRSSTTENGYGAHAERSVASPSSTWYLAEGATHSGFDLFYLVQNPSDFPVDLNVDYLRPAPAVPLTRSYRIAPHSRFNIWVNHESPELAATDVSAVLRADAGEVIVERAMYLRGAHLFEAGHGSAGVTAPATAWYFAEGATGSFFDMFLLLANPGEHPAFVRAEYLLPDGRTYEKDYFIQGLSRETVWVDLEEAPAGSGRFPLADTAVSVAVRSINNVPIIAERAMWWPGDSTQWLEAHAAVGATFTSARWAVAESESVPGSAETYILVANTSAWGGGPP